MTVTISLIFYSAIVCKVNFGELCLVFSGLPYDVTIEQALGYEAVRNRITQSIQALKSCTDMFLDSILRNVNKIP